MLTHSNILGLFFRKCCVRVGGVLSVYLVYDLQCSASLGSYTRDGQDSVCVGSGGGGGSLSCQAALRHLGDIVQLRIYSFSKTCFLGRENALIVLSLTDGKGLNK